MQLSIVNYLPYKETEGPVIIFYGIKWKDLLKQQTLQEHKLVQLDMLWYKWFSSAFWRKPHDLACDSWKC
jgi:hypothetical protein